MRVRKFCEIGGDKFKLIGENSRIEYLINFIRSLRSSLEQNLIIQNLRRVY